MSEDRISIIRRMANEGKTLISIAVVLGVSKQRIHQIANEIGVTFNGKRRRRFDFERLRLNENMPDKTYCRTDIEAARIRKLLDYDCNTGFWTWRVNGLIATHAGGHGYLRIWLDKKMFVAHTLVWPYLFDRWPKNTIDHVNRIKDDNRLVNLREATLSQNFGNQGKRKHNKSGYKGVCWDKVQRHWRAEIAHIKLGRFETAEEAALAYDDAARQRYGEFAVTNFVQK